MRAEAHENYVRRYFEKRYMEINVVGEPAAKGGTDKAQLLISLKQQIIAQFSESAAAEFVDAYKRAEAGRLEAEAAEKLESEDEGAGSQGAGDQDGSKSDGRTDGFLNQAVETSTRKMIAELEENLDFENSSCVDRCVHYDPGMPGEAEEEAEERIAEEKRVAALSPSEKRAEEERVAELAKTMEEQKEQ